VFRVVRPSAICSNMEKHLYIDEKGLFLTTVNKEQSSWQNLSRNQTTAEFVKYAANLGLNVDNFKSCIAQNEHLGKSTDGQVRNHWHIR
jgi:hypothetical protein